MRAAIVIRPRLAAAACGITLLAAGCGSGGGSPGGASSTSSPASSSAATATSNSALCADAAALRASLDKLRHVKVGTGTANEITADLSEVQTALTTLVNNARGQWHTQTSALSTALAGLKTAAGHLAASPGASTVSGVVAALGQVNTAAQNLLAAVNTSCPSASPSSSG